MMRTKLTLQDFQAGRMFVRDADWREGKRLLLKVSQVDFEPGHPEFRVKLYCPGAPAVGGWVHYCTVTNMSEPYLNELQPFVVEAVPRLVCGHNVLVPKAYADMSEDMHDDPWANFQKLEDLMDDIDLYYEHGEVV